jgi:t-SNARE complex subunit (syntaxin)
MNNDNIDEGVRIQQCIDKYSTMLDEICTREKQIINLNKDMAETVNELELMTNWVFQERKKFKSQILGIAFSFALGGILAFNEMNSGDSYATYFVVFLAISAAVFLVIVKNKLGKIKKIENRISEIRVRLEGVKIRVKSFYSELTNTRNDIVNNVSELRGMQ